MSSRHAAPVRRRRIVLPCAGTRPSLACHVLCCAADAAQQQLADQIEQHTQKARKARIDEAVAGTEVTLSKIIAVNAVELLGNFPPDLWKQLHTARKQVGLAALASHHSPWSRGQHYVVCLWDVVWHVVTSQFAAVLLRACRQSGLPTRRCRLP